MTPDSFRQHPPLARSSKAKKGRASLSNHDSRYSSTQSVWDEDDAEAHPRSVVTECLPEQARSIIARNNSPDIPFDQSINPYRGCEHGCIYCYARPTHAWLDLSPGLDFETRLRHKVNAASVLEQELHKPNYRCSNITLGANTDPYQPVEKQHQITRQLLEVMLEYKHPVSIITKSTLVERDIDLLSALARDNLCHVAISVTTLDRSLKRAMEPRTASGQARLETLSRLSAAGIPTSLLYAPVIPALNDAEMETLVAAAAAAGANAASYILLRLPLEIRDLFEEWLHSHFPARASHVLSIIRQSRGGKDYDSRFGYRMRGTGQFADLLSQRFALARRKHGLGDGESSDLNTTLFERPGRAGEQISLFQ